MSVPPQVDDTPGAPFTVTEDEFVSSFFRLEYPAGWRVITNEAARPLVVIFAAPANDALLMIAVGTISDPPTPPNAQFTLRTETSTVVFGSETIGIYRAAPAAIWEHYAPLFDRALSTLRAP